MIIPRIKCKWVKSHPTKELVKVGSALDAVNILRSLYEPHEIGLRENFYALFLNRNNRVIGYDHISKGTQDMSLVDVKMIAAPALGVMANQVIICHNHPSGSLKPSQSDVLMTKKIREALLLFGITLIDHIILTETDFHSMVSEGTI